MAKSKEVAKAEGFKRGLAGKVGASGLIQAWNDDEAASTARNQGYVEGKRKRSRLKAEEAAEDKRLARGKK